MAQEKKETAPPHSHETHTAVSAADALSDETCVTTQPVDREILSAAGAGFSVVSKIQKAMRRGLIKLER